MIRTHPGLSAPAVAIALAAMLTGCEKNQSSVGHESIVGSGKIVSETRTTASFSGIQVSGVGTLYVTQDSAQSIRIEADDNIINLVQTSVAGDILNVGLREGSYSHTTVKVFVSTKAISFLGISGAGTLETTNPIHSESLTCQLSGAGTMTAAGKVSDEHVLISGTGSAHNFGLSSARCEAKLAGTGSIEVTVSDQLDAAIMGTGSIVYDGNPPRVNKSVSGIGSIHPR